MAGYMQFWGVEVTAKEPCKVSLGEGSLVHISHITLSDIKKDEETVIVQVEVGDKKLVLARLSNNTPQLATDLVFDEDFEISHNWKNGNIHLLGYQNAPEESDSEIDSSEEELEDDVPIAMENGELASQAATIAPAVKPKAADKSKPEVNGESDDDGSSDSDFDGDSSDDDDSNEDGASVSEGDDEDNSDESDDSEEETPAKVVDTGKKRPNADAKTPPQSKKAKMATPQKTDGKKDGKPTTPQSSKKGDIPCGSCKKTFKTGTALEAHTKDKHGAK